VRSENGLMALGGGAASICCVTAAVKSLGRMQWSPLIGGHH